MKSRVTDLAIFGGPPLFASPRPIGQLSVPPVEDYLARLTDSLTARQLTNNGPLACQLERRLADHHGMPHCIAVANAGLGIMMLLQVLSKGQRGEVIMPAFSYRGLPHFARWAGQEPRFCDVDAVSHFLDLRGVEAAIGPATTCILGVANVHDPGDVEGLCRLARRQGLPLVLDAVYAMHGNAGIGLPAADADAEVYSLHVTKLLAGFEGGYVLTRCPDLAKALQWQRNFCLPALRPAPGRLPLDTILGLNAKLNEFHAAMALASLDRLPLSIELNQRRYEAYAMGLQGIAGLRLLPYRDPAIANFQMAILEVEPAWPLSRDETVQLLRAEGMAVNGLYTPPLHKVADRTRARLPVAESLSKRYLQLPVGEFVDQGDVTAICDYLQFLARHGKEIAHRLTRGGNG